MIYIIDTSSLRKQAWRVLLTDNVRFAQEIGYIKLTADDVVYAHAHQVGEGKGSPDFVLTDGDWSDRKLQNFRRALIEAASKSCAPLLILYSGESISDERARQWRITVCGDVLPKYPPSMVAFYAGRAREAADADAAREIMSAAPDSDERLAMRLLCEAWLIVDQAQPTGGVNVTARQDVIAWCAPFAKEPTDPPELEAVAGRMGDAQGDCLMLLKALAGRQEGDAELVRRHVKRLLAKLTRTPAGTSGEESTTDV